MREKKRALPSSSAMTALLLSFSMLLLWGVSMACLTNVTAQFAAARALRDSSGYASLLAGLHYTESAVEGDTGYENLLAWQQWSAACDGRRPVDNSAVSGADGRGNGFLIQSTEDTFSFATAVFDARGELLACSWENFFHLFLADGGGVEQRGGRLPGGLCPRPLRPRVPYGSRPGA